MREAYRLTVLGPVQALGVVVSSELSEALGQPVTLDFDATKAIDVGQRARGVKVLTDAGLTIDEALDTMGLT